MARPVPREAPVISATVPFNLLFIGLKVSQKPAPANFRKFCRRELVNGQAGGAERWFEGGYPASRSVPPS